MTNQESTTMTVLAFMLRLHEICKFWSWEQNRVASNSEIRRWIEQGAILFNTERVSPTELVDFHVFSLVLFPKSAHRRCTLV